MLMTCCLIFLRRRTKIPRLQPPRQLKALDDLLAQAVHYATICMRNSGKMAPTVFRIVDRHQSPAPVHRKCLTGRLL